MTTTTHRTWTTKHLTSKADRQRQRGVKVGDSDIQNIKASQVLVKHRVESLEKQKTVSDKIRDRKGLGGAFNKNTTSEPKAVQETIDDETFISPSVTSTTDQDPLSSFTRNGNDIPPNIDKGLPFLLNSQQDSGPKQNAETVRLLRKSPHESFVPPSLEDYELPSKSYPPRPESNKTHLVFHVGPPKTGTTTLQTDLTHLQATWNKTTISTPVATTIPTRHPMGTFFSIAASLSCTTWPGSCSSVGTANYDP